MSVLVGKMAPDFTASAVMPNNEINETFNLHTHIKGRIVILFFYPLDFTFVCPTEIIAFQNVADEFEKRNVAVVGCSVDSKFSHWAWLQTERKNGGIKGVKFPLVSDLTKAISQNYDVLAGEYTYNENGEVGFSGAPVAYRGLFLIDKQGIVRHQVVNDLPLGRSVDEALRMVDALQFFEENGEVCPANWHKGEAAMKATQQGVSEYLAPK